MSFFPDGEKLGFTSCLLRNRARDWWAEVTRYVGTVMVVEMTWVEFVQKFQREFALAIEVQQLRRELQDLRRTTETISDITTKYRERAWLVPQYTADEEMI